MTRPHQWDKDNIRYRRERHDQNKRWFVPQKLNHRKKIVRFDNNLQTELWYKTSEQMQNETTVNYGQNIWEDGYGKPGPSRF